MTIKGVLVLGEFGYKQKEIVFDKIVGLKVIPKVFNFKKSLLNKEFFIIPIMNEFGMNIENINDSFSINENYINSSSILVNNQYIKDNELMSELNVTTSQFKIQVTMPRIVDNKGYFLSNPLQKLAKGYIDLLRYNFKENYITKNILQFKSQKGENVLFVVHNLPEMMEFIDKYQVELRENEGVFQNIINRTDAYKKTEDRNYHYLLFAKSLARDKLDFEGNVFTLTENNEDGTMESETTAITQTDIDLDMLLYICNIYYQTGHKVFGLDYTVKNPITGEESSPFICMIPIVDFSQVTYLDTSGNVILAGKLTGISKSQAIASGNTLDLYDISISPKMSSGFIKPALISYNYTKKIHSQKEKQATKDLKKTETLGRNKTTFDTLK